MQISSTWFLTTMSALDAFLAHVSLLGSWLSLTVVIFLYVRAPARWNPVRSQRKALSGLKRGLAAPAGGHIPADLRPWEQQLPKSVRAIAIGL